MTGGDYHLLEHGHGKWSEQELTVITEIRFVSFIRRIASATLRVG
jgi:hypothetical protein